jgi:hypothetical protein
MFLLSPEKNAKEVFHVNKIHVVRCININKLKEAEAAERQRQADIEAGIPEHMIQPLDAESQAALEAIF